MQKIYADNETQIKAASKEMTNIIKGLRFDQLVAYGAEGVSWKFTAPDALWQNGWAEALIKSLKKMPNSRHWGTFVNTIRNANCYV